MTTRSQSMYALVRHLRPFLLEQRWLYLAGGIFAITMLGAQLAYPQLIRIIIDEGIQTQNLDLVNRFAMAMVALVVIQAGSTYMNRYFFEYAEARFSARVKSWLFSNLLRQEIGFFDKNNTGELLARLSSDTQTLGRLLNPWLAEGIRFTLMGIGSIGLMLWTSPTLSILIVMLGPVLWFATSLLGRRVRKQSRSVQDLDASVNEVALETLNGIRTVRSYHAESLEAERYWDKVTDAVASYRRRVRTVAGLEAVTSLSAEAAVVVGIWVGAVLIHRGELTAGALVTFIFYANMVVRSLRNLSQFFAEAMRAQGATERVFQLGHREPEMAVEGGLEPVGSEGVIRLEGVHFSYPTRPDEAALRGVDLEIRPGEIVALVGASGSGKSTIASLIARFYEPDRGRVTLDGTDLADLDPEWLRRQITLVPSDATLFARSVADNIRFGRRDATDAEVAAAAHVANAAAFIEELAMAYQADSGDRGVRFSSGQKQRIAIARAILRKPRILILDEATAALDSESEALIKERLRKQPDHPTIVIVAHRLSTVVDVDRAVMIEKGRIVDSGRHEELMARCAPYRDLFVDQLGHD